MKKFFHYSVRDCCKSVLLQQNIKACCNLPKGTRIINIDYVGSNNLEIGTVSLVSDSFRYTDGNYKFDDHANPLHLSDDGLPCHTGNSFFTESDRTELTLAWPYPDSFTAQEAFHAVLGSIPRITAASLIAFVAGDFMNDRVFARMKRKHPDMTGFAWRARKSRRLSGRMRQGGMSRSV